MSYANFKPIVWSKHIQRELEQSCVLWDGCNHEFQGEAKLGNKVKILGVARPTIGNYLGTDIGSPETPPDTSVTLDINQAKFFNFGIDDVDKAQSVEGLMPNLMGESSEGLAEERDKFVAGLYAGAGKKSTDSTVDADTEARDAVDTAFEYLWGNGVKLTEKCEIVIAPWFYTLFKRYLLDTSTDNVELLKKGIVGIYNNAEVKISNLLTISNGYTKMIVRTKKAVAAVGQINETEAYRPEGLFMDAVKGLDTFGAKVVRPKEMYIISAKFS